MVDDLEDELSDFLQAAAEEGEITLGNTTEPKTQTNGDASAVVPGRDAYDSSDEEDLSNFFERKYNEYGRDINHMLKRKDADRVDAVIGGEVSKNLRQSEFVAKKSVPPAPPKPVPVPVPISKPTEDVYKDPVFGLRLIQPLISSTALRERMLGRTNVEIRSLQYHLQNSDLSKDWCVCGVIVSKSVQTSNNSGSQYVIWRLSDLKGEIKSVSLFLFKSAFKELWKTAVGMIIAVLNPSVFSRKDNNGESSLSIGRSFSSINSKPFERGTNATNFLFYFLQTALKEL